MFVEVVDLIGAGRDGATGPDTTGVPGGGGGAGRAGEPSCPSEVDDDTCGVDDHAADLGGETVEAVGGWL